MISGISLYRKYFSKLIQNYSSFSAYLHVLVSALCFFVGACFFVLENIFKNRINSVCCCMHYIISSLIEDILNRGDSFWYKCKHCYFAIKFLMNRLHCTHKFFVSLITFKYEFKVITESKNSYYFLIKLC